MVCPAWVLPKEWAIDKRRGRLTENSELTDIVILSIPDSEHDRVCTDAQKIWVDVFGQVRHHFKRRIDKHVKKAGANEKPGRGKERCEHFTCY